MQPGEKFSQSDAQRQLPSGQVSETPENCVSEEAAVLAELKAAFDEMERGDRGVPARNFLKKLTASES